MTIPWNFTGCYSIEEWKKIFEDWEKSGLSKAVYCQMRDIPYHNFIRWQNKIYPSTSLSHGELRERWNQLIKNWEKSGLSKHAYCQSKGLNSHMFYLREKELNSHLSRKTSHMEAVERWTPIVEDWKRSGLNKFAYCKKYGLASSSFHKWTTILASSEPSQSQINLMKEPPIEISSQTQIGSHCRSSGITNEASPANQRIQVTFAHGQYFRLKGPFDWPKLMAWLTPLLTSRK